MPAACRHGTATLTLLPCSPAPAALLTSGAAPTNSSNATTTLVRGVACPGEPTACSHWQAGPLPAERTQPGLRSATACACRSRCLPLSTPERPQSCGDLIRSNARLGARAWQVQHCSSTACSTAAAQLGPSCRACAAGQRRAVPSARAAQRPRAVPAAHPSTLPPCSSSHRRHRQRDRVPVHRGQEQDAPGAHTRAASTCCGAASTCCGVASTCCGAATVQLPCRLPLRRRLRAGDAPQTGLTAAASPPCFCPPPPTASTPATGPI